MRNVWTATKNTKLLLTVIMTLTLLGCTPPENKIDGVTMSGIVAEKIAVRNTTGGVPLRFYLLIIGNDKKTVEVVAVNKEKYAFTNVGDKWP